MAGSDLGSDTGSVSMNIGAKLIEALFKLLEKIYQAWKDAPQRKLQKVQLAEVKEKEKRAKAIRKMDGIEGEVQWEKLKKLSQLKESPIMATGIMFHDEADLMRFAELAKRNHVVWSGVHDPSKGVGEQTTHIHTLASDVEKVKAICEQISDEKRISAIDKKIAEIEAVGKERGSYTEQEQANLENLKATKEAIIGKYTEQFNQKSFDTVIDETLNPKEEIENEVEKTVEEDKEETHGEKGKEEMTSFRKYEKSDTDKESTLAKALDTETGRTFDVDRTSVIADASNPQRFILASSTRDTFRDEEYTKTSYEVHNPNGNTQTFDDGRFEGRPSDYWWNTKQEMLNAGEFSKDATLLKFDNVQDFQIWQSRAIRENEAEKTLRDLQNDYASHINENMAEIEKLGYEIREDGELYNKKLDTKAKDLLADRKAMRSDNPVVKLGMLNAVEAITLYNQIDTFKQLSTVEEQLSAERTNSIIADTPEEKATAEKAVEELSAKKENYINIAKEADEKRRSLNGLENQAREEIRQKENVSELSADDKDWNEEQFKADEEKVRGGESVGHEHESRDDLERINEEEETKAESDISSTMSEYEEQIAIDKAKDAKDKGGNEATHEKDRSVKTKNNDLEK